MGFGRGSWLAAFAGAAVLLLTGCGGQGNEPVPTVQADYPSLVWADGAGLRISKVDLQAATEAVEGKDFKEISNTGQWSLGDESFAAFALDRKGRLVGSMVHNQGIDPATNLLSSGAKVGPVVDGKFEAWPAASGLPSTEELRQVPFGTTDGENFIWYETPEASIVATQWKIFAKHADAPGPVLLAESSDNAQGPVSGAGMGDIEPAIHRDRVYWSTSVAPETGGALSTQLVSTDLAGAGDTRVVEQGAARPVSLDGAVAAIRLESLDPATRGEEPTALGHESATGIVLLKDDGTTVDLLKIGDGATGNLGFGAMKGSGDALSFSFNGETFIVDTKTRDAVAFEEPAGGYLEGLAHCGDVVTWTYSDANGEGIGRQYVYNSSAKTLRVVNEPELFGSSLCQGQYLSWSVRDSSNDGAFATEVVTKWNR